MIYRLLFLSVLLGPCLGGAAAMPDRVTDASSGRTPDAGDWVLFPLDDGSIPWRDNLKLTLERPHKFPGNPILRRGPIGAPDGYGLIMEGTVIKEQGRFRMWYVAEPRNDRRIPGDAERMNYYRPIGYAESADGIHWNRPDLGLVEFRGNKHNNLVQIEPASEPYSRPFATVAVLYDPADPDPRRHYKMAYIGHDWPLRSGATVTATSPDGLRWTLANTTMFTQGHFENTTLFKYDGIYYLAGQNIPPHDAGLADGSAAGRVTKVFFSPDFHHWSHGRALAFYRNDSNPADFQARSHDFGQESHMGIQGWNRGNIILGFAGRWHGDTIADKSPRESSLMVTKLAGLKIDLGLAISNDAIHYREPVRNFVVVPDGAADQWDSEAIQSASAFANTATETYIWYSSWDTGRPDNVPDASVALSPREVQKSAAVGLLTLPRDRFGCFTKLLSVSQERNPAYDAKRDASCLTRSLTLAAPSVLSVNLDRVSPQAALQLALVDDAERPLEGYTAELSQNSLKAPVAWSGGKQSLPVGRPFRVKITWPIGVDDARLYAIYIEHL